MLRPLERKWRQQGWGVPLRVKPSLDEEDQCSGLASGGQANRKRGSEERELSQGAGRERLLEEPLASREKKRGAQVRGREEEREGGNKTAEG